MVIIFFVVEAVVLLSSLFLSNITLKLFRKILSRTKYKVTVKFRYFSSFFIMLTLGIIAGKMIIIKFI